MGLLFATQALNCCSNKDIRPKTKRSLCPAVDKPLLMIMMMLILVSKAVKCQKGALRIEILSADNKSKI